MYLCTSTRKPKGRKPGEAGKSPKASEPRYVAASGVLCLHGSVVSYRAVLCVAVAVLGQKLGVEPGSARPLQR